MKTRVGILLLVLSALIVTAAQPRATRVPPRGVAISETDRAELRAGADALAAEIVALRSTKMSELLPDVEIYHKAVDWALRYDEFYSNQVNVARTLLKQGAERAKQLREGKPGWLSATGLVVRGYVSKIDGSVQPYGLVVPASFRAGAGKFHRLDVWLHGRDNNLTELKFISDRSKSYGEFTPADTFVLHPYGRYCNAFKFAGEVDVFEALEHAKRSYMIDAKRIALRGFSMGGAGVWHLGAHHPDVWTVAAPGAGFAETAEYQKIGTNRARFPSWEQTLWQLYDATDYAGNFFNLPVVAYNGTQDDQRQAADVMERAMKREGLALPRVWGTNINHQYTPVAKKELSAFVDAAIERGHQSFPDEIHFTTRTLRYNRAPGVEIVHLEKHWQRADVRVRHEADHLNVVTTNVSELTLSRAVAGPELRNVRIDGQELHPVIGLGMTGAKVTLFKAADGQWADTGRIAARSETLRKRHGLQGPIDDAFMESFLVVRATGKPMSEAMGTWTSSRLTAATNDWRAQFRGDARVKDDSAVTDADIAAHNLILFGDPQSNKLLARIADKLPIRWDADAVKVGDKTFPAATHAPVFIFPNPLNPKRYVVVNSGFTFAAAGFASNAQQTPKLPDYAVMEMDGNSAVLADFFDERWRLW